MKSRNIFPNPFQFKSFLFNLIILSLRIKFFFSTKCPKDVAITNTSCFNDVLLFNSKYYRAGHFATYKNGDLIVEFSDDGGSSDGYSRIFYGLTKDGKYYFPNNSPTYEITNIGNIDGARGRYESLNQLVVTENDFSRENEYLFSTSSYDSLTELHKMEDRTYTIAKTKNFMEKQIFSFQYSMVEVNYSGKIFYFIAFTYGENASRGNFLEIKNFGFNSFSLSNYDSMKTISINYNQENRIVNLFALENLDALVLMYAKNDNKLYFKFYDYELNQKGGEIGIANLENFAGDGIFFKSVKLPGNKRAISFYQNGNGQYLYFRVYEFYKNWDFFSNSEILSTQTDGSYWFSTYVTYNDIIKIKNNRIAVATVSSDLNGLVLLIYDLYNDYKNVKTRWYYFNIQSINLEKELSLYSFNGYLMLSMTGKSNNHFFADLIIFGYANGTDVVKNISY